MATTEKLTKIGAFVRLANELGFSAVPRLQTMEDGSSKPRVTLAINNDEGDRHFLNWSKTDKTDNDGKPVFILALGKQFEKQPE